MNTSPALETAVLTAVVDGPLGADELVNKVRASNPHCRAVDVKTVALNLVLAGRATLDDAWRFCAR